GGAIGGLFLSARAARQGGVVRTDGDRGLPAVRLSRVLAGIDLVASRNRRLLRASGNRIYDRQLPRRVGARDRRQGAVQQLHDLNAGDGTFARRHGDVRIHVVALQGTDPERLVFIDLHFSLRALRRVGAAALFRDAATSYFRQLLGAAAAAHCRAHLLLLLDHERLLRRHRPLHGIRGHDRRLLALGRVLAGGHAGGNPRPHRARDLVLALHLERGPVRPPSDGA